MIQQLQLGKYEFFPYQFGRDDEYEKLLKELELLSLSEIERDKRRKELVRKLANLKQSKIL